MKRKTFLSLLFGSIPAIVLGNTIELPKKVAPIYNPNAWIEEYKKYGLSLSILNKLVTSHRKLNKYDENTKYILSLGKKEFEYLKTCSYSGYSLKLNKNHRFEWEYILDMFHAELELINKDSYLWVREK